MEVVLKYSSRKVDKKLKDLAEKYWKRNGFKHAYYVEDLKTEFKIPENESISKYINDRCLAIIKGFEYCNKCCEKFTFNNRDKLYKVKHIGGMHCPLCSTFNTYNEFPEKFSILELQENVDIDELWPASKLVESNLPDQLKEWPDSPENKELLSLMVSAYETDRFRHLSTLQHNFLLSYCKNRSIDIAAKRNGVGKELKLKLVDFLIQEHLLCNKTGFVLPALRSILMSEGEDIRAKNVFGFNDLKETLYNFLCNSKLNVFPGYPISRIFDMNQVERYFTPAWSRQHFLTCQVGYLVTSKSYNPLFVVDYLNRNKLEDSAEINKQKAKKDFFLNLGLPHHEVVFEDLNDMESLKVRLGLC